MLDPKKIVRRQYDFTINDPFHQTRVEVKIPDLSGLDFQVWGDWGPMYTYTLAGRDKIQIKYNGKLQKSDQKSLRVESPMFAKERELAPYYLVLEDQAKGVNFYLYISKKGELTRTKVIRRKDHVMLFDHIFDENYAKAS